MSKLLLSYTLMLCMGLQITASAQPGSGEHRPSAKKNLDVEAISYVFSGAVLGYLNGNMKQAQETFSELAEATQNNHTPSLYYLSLIRHQLSDTLGAVNNIRKALEREPDNVTYLNQYAQLLVDTQDFERANIVLETLVSLDTKNIQTKVYWIITTFFSSRQPLAIDRINAFEKKYGIDQRLFELKRDYYLQTKRYDELTDYIHQALQENPQDVERLMMLAQLYAAKSQDSLALQTYQQAITANPDNLQAKVALADYWRIKANPQKFLLAVEPLLKANQISAPGKIELLTEIVRLGAKPSDTTVQNITRSTVLAYRNTEQEAEMYDYYVDYLLFIGDFPAAETILRQLYRTNALKGRKQLILPQVLHHNQKTDSALMVVDGLLANHPDNSDLWAFGSMVAAERKEEGRAFKYAKGLITNASTDSMRSVAHTIRGDLYHQLGRNNKAYGEYTKALKYDTTNAAALNNWAYFLSEEGKQLDKALEMSLKSNELETQNATYLDTLAWIYFKLGRYTQAKQTILLALGLGGRSTSAEVLLHGGDIHQKLGEIESAKRYWQRALEKGADPQVVEKRLNP